MNYLHKLRKPYLSGFLALLILFTSCNQNDSGIVENMKETSEERFSGEELFTSIIFREGKAASLFPTRRKSESLQNFLNDSEKREEYKKTQVEAIAYLRADNPDFFNDFQKSMYSQDPVIIKEAINNASKKLFPFISKKLKNAGIDYEVSLKNPQSIGRLKQDALAEYHVDQNIDLTKVPDNEALVVAVQVAVVAVVVVVVAAVLVAYTPDDKPISYPIEELSGAIATQLQ